MCAETPEEEGNGQACLLHLSPSPRLALQSTSCPLWVAWPIGVCLCLGAALRAGDSAGSGTPGLVGRQRAGLELGLSQESTSAWALIAAAWRPREKG